MNDNDNMNLANIVDSVADNAKNKRGRTKLGNAKLSKTKGLSNNPIYGVLGVVSWVATVALIAGDIASAFGAINLKYGIALHLILTIGCLAIRKKNGSRSCEICAFVNVIASCGIMYMIVKEIGIWDKVDIKVINE